MEKQAPIPVWGTQFEFEFKNLVYDKGVELFCTDTHLVKKADGINTYKNLKPVNVTPEELAVILAALKVPVKLVLVKTNANVMVSLSKFKDTDSDLKITKVDMMSDCDSVYAQIGEDEYTEETLVDVVLTMGTEMKMDLNIKAGETSATATITLTRI